MSFPLRHHPIDEDRSMETPKDGAPVNVIRTEQSIYLRARLAIPSTPRCGDRHEENTCGVIGHSILVINLSEYCSRANTCTCTFSIYRHNQIGLSDGKVGLKGSD